MNIKMPPCLIKRLPFAVYVTLTSHNVTYEKPSLCCMGLSGFKEEREKIGKYSFCITKYDC